MCPYRTIQLGQLTKLVVWCGDCRIDVLLVADIASNIVDGWFAVFALLY